MNVFPTSIPDLDIRLDTPEWFEWLDSQTQFKYCGNLTEMSVKRRPNGMWYARKKINSSNGSKPIDLYVGSDEECTSDKLKEINYHFGKDNSEFWRWYYSPDRKEGKSKGVQPKPMYTPASPTAPSGEEITQLRAEVERLTKLAEHYERERDNMANLMAGRDARHAEQVADLVGKIEQLENRIAELKTLCKRINLDCKTYKLHGHEVVRLEDLTKLGYELQRSLTN
jgi:hypothetical protein